MLVVAMLCFCSCGDDEPFLPSEIEGTYVGTFTKNWHNGAYVKETAHSGSITISRQPNGKYSMRLYCVGYNLDIQIENVIAFVSEDGATLSHLMSDVDYDVSESPQFYQYYGSITKDRQLFANTGFYVYGECNEGYVFDNGNKNK